MDSLANIIKDAAQAIAGVAALHDLDQIKAVYLGKKGKLTEMLKELGKLDPEARPKAGQEINVAKNQIIALLDAKQQELKNFELTASLAQEAIDITLPGRGQELGRLHPITQTRYAIQDFFMRMGFSVLEGPEVEDEFYNFTALNIPQNHPARADHDTFYFPDGRLLRTHTSPMQIRVMQNNKPPLRILVPGRVYRCDSDATHSPMFNQVEGLIVDENINFANLKWLLNKFLESFFQEKIAIRFRPSFFPFTEPSADVYIQWKVGEELRWLEVLGCGMVHPNVLTAGGVDPQKYSGLAFGMGVDRLAMLRYGIKDIRTLFENDIELLQQF
jgi:phenylalanyl-tRNA synthetase alpha chain